jgi:hypothetical protein
MLRRALSAELFAALCAAGGQNRAAILCRHASTEAVAALANQIAGLECTFHLFSFLLLFRARLIP